MNIHDKIQKIFSQTRSDAPEWAIELLEELKSIKHLLETTKQEQDRQEVFKVHLYENKQRAV